MIIIRFCKHGLCWRGQLQWLSITHGLPVVSYRFNYGPAEYIDEGVNGYLIDSGQSLAMAEKIDLFNDDKLLADFKGVYVSAYAMDSP